MKDRLFNATRILRRSRYPWVDYARGITIILVVYRHVFEGIGGGASGEYRALEYFNAFFFSFRMPLFFMISGLFFSQTFAKNGLPLYIKKRFSTILYPLLIWGVMQITLQLVLKNYVNANRQPIDYINLLIKPREIEQFWYLNALFFVATLYAILTHYLKFKVKQQLIFGSALFIASAFISKVYTNNGKYPWELGFIFDVMFFYVFFAFGDVVSKVVLSQKNYRIFTSFKTALIMLPAFILVQYFFTETNLAKGNDYFVQYQMPALYIPAAVIGGAFIVCISFLLEKWQVLKFLRVIGYHSLYIYAAHLLVTAGTRIIFTKLLGITYPPAIMTAGLFLGITIPMILYNIAVRNGAWWLFSSMPPPDVPVKR